MPPTNIFIGEYVKEIVNLLTASACANVHALLITRPGFGKTEIARAAAQAISGGRYNFTALAPSTPPSLVEGIYNPKMFLEGKLERMTTGTAMDPHNRIVVLDELFRASEPVFDALLHVLDRKDLPPNARPTVWATSNFAIADERTEALRDRLALWAHLYPTVTDLDGILDAFSAAFSQALELTLPQAVPDWGLIENVRAATPGEKAHRAVSDFIKSICEEIANPPNPEQPNPRHLRQWYTLFFRYSFYLTGSNDFSDIPEQAKQLIRYAWVQPDRQEWEKWGKKVHAVADLTGAVIAGILLRTMHSLNDILDKGQKNRSTSEEMATKMGFTSTVQEAIKDLAARGGNDVRVGKAVTQLNGMLGRVLRGEKITPDFDL